MLTRYINSFCDPIIISYILHRRTWVKDN